MSAPTGWQRKGHRACAAAAAASTFRPTGTGGATATLRPAGQATSRWIRCRTEGRRGERGGRGGERGRRVIEVVGEPVGKRRSIIATVPGHGDLSPRTSPRESIHSLCSWSIHGCDGYAVCAPRKGPPCRMRVGAPAALAYKASAAPEHTCRLPASHMICSRVLCRVRCFPSK
jgi:hypothetical protein